MKNEVLRSIGRIFALVVVVLAACVLSGCGASLTVYDYTKSGRRCNVYELKIDADTVNKMEATAAEKQQGGKYTVEEYFYTLFTDNGYKLLDAKKSEDGYFSQFEKTFGSEETPELFTLGAAIEYVSTYSENPFVRKYDRISPNPFNNIREKYDSVRPNQSAELIQKLKNGIVIIDEYGDRQVIFPSVTAAFPYLAAFDPAALELNYAVLGSERMESSGRAVDAGGGNSFYVFSRYFDTAQTQIEFKYDRPVIYGWYIVALAAGGVTVALFVFFTRTKKEKPTLLDRFPYNPEEYRDYENHLPSNR